MIELRTYGKEPKRFMCVHKSEPHFLKHSGCTHVRGFFPPVGGRPLCKYQHTVGANRQRANKIATVDMAWSSWWKCKAQHGKMLHLRYMIVVTPKRESFRTPESKEGFL